MHTPQELICQAHAQPLTTVDGRAVEEVESLTCSRGCRVPVVACIPRFVASDEYASGFGLQWKAFRRTQLDSQTGTTISRDRLVRCLGGPLDVLRGQSVLEVGCGAGR